MRDQRRKPPAKEAKTDNSDTALKVSVREWVAERIGQPDDLAVLDLFCGRSGEMYQAVWAKAGLYLGVDKHQPHKLARTIRCSAEVAVQELDLDLFNVFDVDCYDSPWVVARRILRRRGQGRFGLVLTSGEGRGMKNGNCNEIIRRTIGASGLSDLRMLGRYQDMVIGLMVASLARMPGVTLEAGIKGIARKQNLMYYVGLIAIK